MIGIMPVNADMNVTGQYISWLSISSIPSRAMMIGRCRIIRSRTGNANIATAPGISAVGHGHPSTR